MLRIPHTLYHDLRQHGEATYPHECCGILLGQVDGDTRTVEEVVRCGNTRADSPHNRYHIAPQELIAAQRRARETGADIIGFYHSHPDHPPQWSPTDFAEAHWIGCSYLITSVEKGTAWVTNSFALCGTVEENKRFEGEEIQKL
ncbi:MAG: M67 family metallopeptidase [Acidobacteriales bacterium]|nr:M67 family metallopeptidase [Terriglobales bacterium]